MRGSNWQYQTAYRGIKQREATKGAIHPSDAFELLDAATISGNARKSLDILDLLLRENIAHNLSYKEFILIDGHLYYVKTVNIWENLRSSS